MTGVYMIYNKLKSKFYVGSTYKSVKWRYSMHFCNARRLNALGKKLTPLQYDMIHDGSENFTLIEVCTHEKNVRDVEKEKILELRGSDTPLYNKYIPNRTIEEKKELGRINFKRWRNKKLKEDPTYRDRERAKVYRNLKKRKDWKKFIDNAVSS